MFFGIHNSPKENPSSAKIISRIVANIGSNAIPATMLTPENTTIIEAINIQLTFLSPSWAKLVTISTSDGLSTVPSLAILPGVFSSS